ncbi:MAG: diacylglycerol kinase family protein [Anaerolineae bacterium]
MDRERPPTLLESFRYAGLGVLYVLRTQRNFRIHLVVTGGVVLLALWVGLSRSAWAILALTVGRVLIAEMFNTAAETLVDLASPRYHPLAKLVKDLAAGAVLLSALIAVIVGVLLLGSPLVEKLQTMGLLELF